MADEHIDLRAEAAKRRDWFFETQLRGFNLQTFRNIARETKDLDELQLLELFSTSSLVPVGLPGPGRGPRGERPRVYLDSHQPVWDADEHTRRQAFGGAYIGRLGDWLEFRDPQLLRDRNAVLAKDFEQERFGSALEKSPLYLYRRKRATTVPIPKNWVPGQLFDPLKGEAPYDGDRSATDNTGQAISRAFVAEAKPWLIPELYHPAHRAPKAPAGTPEFAPLQPSVRWLEDLEKFLADFEAELRIVVGGAVDQRFPFADNDSGKRDYRGAINEALRLTTTGDAAGRVQAQFLSTVEVLDDKRVPRPAYRFGIRIGTAGRQVDDVEKYPHSEMVKYWLRVVDNPVKEVFANKENSDMGLCHLIRMVYLFGTLPAKLAGGDKPPWRRRPDLDTETFDEFFAHRAADDGIAGDTEVLARLRAAQEKLRIVLAESRAVPNSAAVTFSPIAQEVLRKAIHHYKFWLDEPLHAVQNAAFQKVRGDLGYDTENEMEYWSENHYIMFASSEYLAGQLWEADEFQPAGSLLGGNKEGVLTGKQRRERGKARVLRWLNHRILFGWTEFNSSGYYREHLWSVLNLVDFALDEEVREKAKIAADLLLFDIARFTHKGAMGAPGGRSQLSSKASGWDNAAGDAVEILFGTRGLFTDGDSEIGAALASSTYEIPEVLLEIAAHPPETGFIDRSRVSITFDEAHRYGLWFSQRLDEIDSYREGYAPKLEKYSRFVRENFEEIEAAHPGSYDRNDDSTVFWWGASVFLNKQVVKGTLAAVDKFGLDQSGVFKQLANLVGTLLPKVKSGGFFGLIGGLVGGVYGAVAGIVLGALFNTSDAEDIADDLSIFLEGSSRTRANIMTYRNPDIMLSSLQNFRAGQTNFQSNVNQATVNGTLNVFTTSGLVNLDVSPVVAGLGGALAGGFTGAVADTVLGVGGFKPALAALGGVGAVIANEKAGHVNPFAASSDGVDGLHWWTGYFALPMVVQYGAASIIAYDFHGIQDDLADCGSHVFFPKSGFDAVEELRCSAYDDANNSLFEAFDVFHYGPKGFWVFGKYVHAEPGVAAADRRESYIGVFSNQHPTWLSRQEDEVDVYNKAVEAVGKEPIEALREQLADEKDIDKGIDLKRRLREQERIWGEPLPRDYFADRDWHHDGKNIWIVQVGNKAEFGDFERFKQRVSSARVHLDDTGDMECTYHMPTPDGGSQALVLKYGDGGEFHYGNAPLPTDLYPRFENPFVRGGRVEWGQRSYVLEYRGKRLLHNLHDFRKPVRTEEVSATDADKVLGLVIHVRTKDEDMDEKTLGTATVRIGCTEVTKEQIIAVGPVDDDTSHDTEWIFFDTGPVDAAPDMTIDVGHRAFGDGDDEADWNMGFTLQALMGDHSLRDCTVTFDSSDFDEDVRDTGRLPFSIRTGRWRPWEPVPDSVFQGSLTQAVRPPFDKYYYDHCDLFLAAPDQPLRHRRLDSCLTAPPHFAEIPNQQGGTRFTPTCSVRGVSRFPGHLVAAVLDEGKLFFSSVVDKAGTWGPWIREEPSYFGAAVPLASPGTLYAGPSSSLDGVEVVAPGADGHLYIQLDWRTGPSFDLSHLGEAGGWLKITVEGFTLRRDGDIVLDDDRLLVLDTDGALWAKTIIRSTTFPQITPWTKVTDGQSLRTFTLAATTGGTRVLATASDGRIWDGTFDGNNPPRWTPLDLPGGAPVPDGAGTACATPYPDRLDVVAVAADGIVRTAIWTKAGGWASWTPVVPGDQGPKAPPHTPILVHRVQRQLELLIRTEDRNLVRTWWS
ncbi:hypothetical protein DFR70_11393 [Nocardia tenerifensis]|uniref:Uncharacterized protein n=1 Tax=Nocardia tenerifensis TaxID=228006 RepID=A0A318KFV6_9NOCA|nr:hypothetical protein [Nocardia tenerifensis]PXX58758.1 hypothetical protein DFR70_11393 [Nocardia tenerifensis]